VVPINGKGALADGACEEEGSDGNQASSAMRGAGEVGHVEDSPATSMIVVCAEDVTKGQSRCQASDKKNE
jgi:hypothetical protein